jgi:hypothetical protein
MQRNAPTRSTCARASKRASTAHAGKLKRDLVDGRLQELVLDPRTARTPRCGRASPGASQATAHFSIADYHASAHRSMPLRARGRSAAAPHPPPSGLRQTRSTDMKHFDNKVAAITGAGSGMGRSLAVQLAGAGCHLALADKNAVGLAETERIVRALAPSVRVTTRVLDVGDRDAMFAWADETAPRTAA